MVTIYRHGAPAHFTNHDNVFPDAAAASAFARQWTAEIERHLTEDLHPTHAFLTNALAGLRQRWELRHDDGTCEPVDFAEPQEPQEPQVQAEPSAEDGASHLSPHEEIHDNVEGEPLHDAEPHDSTP